MIKLKKKKTHQFYWNAAKARLRINMGRGGGDKDTSIIIDNKSSRKCCKPSWRQRRWSDVKSRLTKACTAFVMIRRVWKPKHSTTKTTLRILMQIQYCYNTEFHTGYEKNTSIIHKQMSENHPSSMVARQNHKWRPLAKNKRNTYCARNKEEEMNQTHFTKKKKTIINC